MKNYVHQIERFDEVQKEIEVSRKYGIDYRAEKGKTQKIIDLYHPSHLDLRVSEIIEETPGAKTLRLVSQTGYLPPFQAGQYINLYGEVHGVRTSRPYSISSSPRQRAYYDITIARISNGYFSDYLLDSVKKGDLFRSSAPSGNFYFNPLFHSKNSVFIAGGSGITPFMSMVNEIYDAGLDRNVTLIYGNRTDENIIFHDRLSRLASGYSNFKYVPVISEPGKSYGGKCGFIDSGCIKDVVADTSDCTYYICGPEAMYDFCLPQLESLKIPQRKIRREMFSSSGDVTKEQGWPKNLSGTEEFTVKIKGNKAVKAKSGETLLASLERAGIVVPVNCRCGECSICRVKLVSGKVFQPRGVLLREADEKFGYIHSCRSYPMEDLEIIL
jgi:ferredoxin-NADP reductase